MSIEARQQGITHNGSRLYSRAVKRELNFQNSRNMNEEQNLNKSTKKAWNIADVIGWLLLVQGIIMCQNSIIWVLTSDDTDKWFSRASIGLICFGFAGVIFRLRK